ncbi:hypothetical protein [Branchiibius cervicis]|uniref:Uncharacterized protein n=1 Tax=Branchiibius cervicis TaxID=908252 RepID=A0ABW2AY36_9MICO
MRWSRHGAWFAAVLIAVAGLVGFPVNASAALLPAGQVATATPTTSATTAFVPINPARVVDTRSGRGVRTGRVPAGGSITITVGGVSGVPAGAQNVILNVTAVNPTADGYLVVQAAGTARAKTSNVNYMRARTTPGLVYVAPSTTGRVTITSSAAVDLVVDVQGYTPQGSAGYHPVAPVRLLDTRSSAAIEAGGTRALRVTGVAGVPTTGVEAVVLTVVGTRSSGAGYVSVSPHGVARPTVSNLNTAVGQTESASVIAKPGTGGTVDIYSSGRTDVVIDVSGWVSSGSNFVAVTPHRIYDQRTPSAPQSSLDGGPQFALGGPASAAGAFLTLTVVGLGAANSGSVVAEPAGLVSFEQRGHQPPTSMVNFQPRHTSSNAAVVAAGLDGKALIDGFGRSNAQVIVDVSGYLLAPAAAIRTDAPTAPSATQEPGTVRCFGSGDCALLDMAGAVWFSQADGSWRRTALPAQRLRALSCTSVDFCVASSPDQQFRWDGSSWSVVSNLVVGSSVILQCPSTTFCVLSDGSRGYVSSDLKSWQPVPQLSSLNGGVVSCASSASCLAVDRSDHQVLWSGTAWVARSAPNPPGVESLSCTDNGCAAVTWFGDLWRWDSGTWTRSATGVLPADPSRTDARVSCAPTGECAAFSGSQVAVTAESGWTAVPQPGSVDLEGLDCGTGTCTLLTADGAVHRWSGQGWSTPDSPVPAWYGEAFLDCPDVDGCMAVDLFGNARRWDGQHWSVAAAVPLSSGDTVRSLHCLSDAVCFAVTSDGALHQWLDQVWSVVPGVRTQDLWCTPDVACTVVDGSSSQRTTGGAWASAGAVGDAPVAVSCVTTHWCMSVDAGGATQIGDGTTWRDAGSTWTDGSIAITGLACTSTSRCLASTGEGVSLLWDGVQWSLQRAGGLAGTGLQAQTLECASASECIDSEGATGTATIWNGQFWSTPVALPSGSFACSSGRCLALGALVQPFDYTAATG